MLEKICLQVYILEEYLYGEGKRLIDQHTTSTICMFKIVNLEEINKVYSREMGNEVVTRVSAFVKQNIASDYFLLDIWVLNLLLHFLELRLVV